ncbi:MAG: glycosyltransferase family A protein, partial [Pseudomonadota bacterium]
MANKLHDWRKVCRGGPAAALRSWKLVSLVISIPTFQRNDALAELLSALQSQAHPAPGIVDVRILVIDNNPDGRAKRVVDGFDNIAATYPVGYVHETRPGVAHVRNRALAETAGDDFLAFIDDDELP